MWNVNHRSNCASAAITLHLLVVERVSAQAIAAAYDLAPLLQQGFPAQALHVDTDPEKTRMLRTDWAEATGKALPLVVLPTERGGSSPGEELVAYVKGALSFDPRLRVSVATVSRRKQPLRMAITVRPTNGVARQLRNAFRDERRVILTDYCEDEDA